MPPFLFSEKSIVVTACNHLVISDNPKIPRLFSLIVQEEKRQRFSTDDDLEWDAFYFSDMSKLGNGLLWALAWTQVPIDSLTISRGILAEYDMPPWQSSILSRPC